MLGYLRRTNGLIAVLLLTRSRPGPRLVFHYPRDPNTGRARHLSNVDNEDNSDLDSDAEEDDNAVTGRQNGLNARSSAEEATVSADLKANRGSKPLADGKVLGYSVDSLEKMLSPGRWCDRKKFEICVEGITFIGHPVYASHDGEWSAKQDDGVPRQPSRSETDQATVPSDQELNGGNEDHLAGGMASITITEPETPWRPNTAVHDFTHIPESLDSQLGGPSLATSMRSTSTASGAVADQMHMFHVVFALSSAAFGEPAEVYQHIPKKLSKALHYCQKQTGYVANESKKMQSIKAKAKQQNASLEDTTKEMLEASELAWALKEIYAKISAGQVAGIRLSGMELSLQIPHPEDHESQEVMTLSPHSGLLLLQDKEILLRELSHPEASPLAYFIREHIATKSLEKHAGMLNMPINDIMFLAEHLIKWRKSKVIAPLHPRNTYVVRPDAPIERLAELSHVYARKFAALPLLPKMLMMLSGKPIRYGLLIPSRDHRAPYMDILAFLDRHGFVAQLKTFGWLRLMEDMTVLPPAEKEERRRPLSGVSLLSPHLRPVEDDSASVSSEKTAVTTVPASQEVEKDVAVAASNGRGHDLVLDPVDPTESETADFQQIRASLPNGELKDAFRRLVQYFDGEHAFEEIAAREGWKRAKVEEWLADLGRRGLLSTFRAL